MTEAPNPADPNSNTALAALARSSYDLIVGLQDASGAFPASPTFSAYRGYSWFRDGAFIADGVSSIGGEESASRFFDWCGRILESRADRIEEIVSAAESGEPLPDAEMLPTRFTFDGEPGADEWWDFQLDGYGTWLWAVVDHAERHGMSLDRWLVGIELTVRYLQSSWRRPCFDWWEEHDEHVHISTLGCIAAGLEAVWRAGVLSPIRNVEVRETIDAIDRLIRSDGVLDGHLVKWVGSSEVDASLASLVSPLRYLSASDPLATRTLAEIDRRLNDRGGVHRFAADSFFGGGRWPLLSCMLGLGFVASGERERAMRQLEWAATTVTTEGFMPEQVTDAALYPDREQEWIDRWGTPATPLLWSHAMFIRLAVELGVAERIGS